MRGNVDCSPDGVVDIGDLTALIDFLFISQASLCCPEEANLNADREVVVDIGDLTALIDYLFISQGSLLSCEGPSGSVVGYSTCKSLLEEKPQGDPPLDQDCIDYSYGENYTLTIKHINAGFNCCPVIAAEIDITDFTITINELDSVIEPCACLCLFDVDYEIANLPPGEYRLIVIEPYRPFGDDELDVVIDLRNPTSGTHCVYRSEYPWGDWFTGVTAHSTCKSQMLARPVSDPPSDQDCIDFSYSENYTLTIKHINAGFNCCPVIAAEIDVTDFTITINELDSLINPCECLCLFDVDYQITGLPPGEYRLIVIEPYKPSGDEELDLVIDLSAPTSGTHCVFRSQYPWETY
ncbi:MAG TPA: hypothetical protein VMY05_06305 [Acidobacteriota bacterium]|nr:hypothetical protein [Acidobacteriota bacterium]